MCNKKVTIEDATRRWVREFNSIPQSFVIKGHGENWFDEITFHTTEIECGYCGCTEQVNGKEDCNDCDGSGKLDPKEMRCKDCHAEFDYCDTSTDANADDSCPKCSSVNIEYAELEGENCQNCNGSGEIESEEKECSSCGRDEFYNTHDFPMWGTMWTFGESLDDWWAKEHLDDMRECGFWVYESDELGVFFGINGAGYDFYESHWIPLYKKRGLQWHDKDLDQEK